MRCIDADALLTDRKKSKYYHLPNGDIAIPIIDIVHAPTIEPEREKGEWIAHKSIFGGLGEMVYTCNKCGYNIGFHKENYCPNCGRDMRGDPDD